METLVAKLDRTEMLLETACEIIKNLRERITDLEQRLSCYENEKANQTQSNGKVTSLSIVQE